MDLEPGVTHFVVLGYQRTGSNLFCGLLSAVPCVNMHFELFNEKASFRRDGETVTDPDVLRLRDVDPCAYFEEAMRDHEMTATAVGFKLFPEHVTRQDQNVFFEPLLADPRVKKILLRRENRVATCASVLRSSVTGSYIRQNLDHVKVKIDPKDLAAFVKGYDDYYAFLRERMAGQHWLELTYEGLVAEKEKEIQRACEWLGVHVPQGVSVLDLGVERDVVKQSTRTLRESIENFEQLRAAFIGTDVAVDFEC